MTSDEIHAACDTLRASLEAQLATVTAERDEAFAAYHEVMQALRRSRFEHGDCESRVRYEGVPRACTACMAKRKLDELLARYQGGPVTLAAALSGETQRQETLIRQSVTGRRGNFNYLR